jgi:hypothetical protein
LVAGQFSIFGASEENGAADSRRFAPTKLRLERSSKAHDPESFWWSWRERRNLVEWAAGISTESAQEMQKDRKKELLRTQIGGLCGVLLVA